MFLVVELTAVHDGTAMSGLNLSDKVKIL